MHSNGWALGSQPYHNPNIVAYYAGGQATSAPMRGSCPIFSNVRLLGRATNPRAIRSPNPNQGSHTIQLTMQFQYLATSSFYI